MLIKYLLMLLLGFSLNIYSGIIFAASPPTIGTVISVQGQVMAIDQAKQQRSLQRRSAIYLNDRIITRQDSKVQFRLWDDSVIVVQPASEFYVSEFSFNKGAPKNNKYVGNIVTGMLINISGQGDPKNYQLNSPLSTIAFRGTGLATRLITKGITPINQEVYVFQGYVTVKNICKNVIGICEPSSIDIGTGQRVNAAVINMVGKIQGMKSSGLVSAGAIAGKELIQGEGGGFSVKCKAKR